jgi:hypothetical protein
LLVRPLNERGFEIVAGARRYRAAQMAEAETVPVRIVNLTDAESLEAQLVENLIRSDVHPMEEANGLRFILHLDVDSVYICCRVFSATIFAIRVEHLRVRFGWFVEIGSRVVVSVWVKLPFAMPDIDGTHTRAQQRGHLCCVQHTALAQTLVSAL